MGEIYDKDEVRTACRWNGSILLASGIGGALGCTAGFGAFSEPPYAGEQ
ncbi:MAG: hypothetical protein ACYC8T_10560 [Myxococcaceae bacterium]